MPHPAPRWCPPTDALRVRRLRHRFGLAEPTARLLAGLCYGEGRGVTDSANAAQPPTEERHNRQEAWRERNPQAYWAHAALRSGIRRGLVTPQPCEVCGEAKAEGHHPDYDKPLDVVWLCRAHHKAVHVHERRATE